MPGSDSVIPSDAAHPHALHALTRKRAEISGQIVQAEARIQNLMTDLEHIDAAIRIFDATVEVNRIRPRRHRARGVKFPGEVTRYVLDALRVADGPVTTHHITQHLMAQRELDVHEPHLFAIMVKRVRKCLREQRDRGTVREVDIVDGIKRWQAFE